MKVEDAAQRLEMNPQTLRLALQQGLLPFGIAVKTSSKRYTYKIFPMRLERYLKGDDVHASLVIFEDTRNKPEKNAHIRRQLEAMGYKVERTKIYCGDYTFPTNQSICVDTKKDMNEVESNLIHDHERFKAECIRAKEAGIKLVILIQDPKLKVLGDVFTWFNVRSKWSPKAATGRQLAKMMYTMQDRYGVEWQFTSKGECGKRIVELLGGSVANAD